MMRTEPPHRRAAIILGISFALLLVLACLHSGRHTRRRIFPFRSIASGGNYNYNFDTTNDDAFKLVLLTEAAKSKGAVCLDGSPGAYYIRRPLTSSSINNTKYLIFHEGGGWCGSTTECLNRSTDRLGSSTGYPLTISPNAGEVEAPALYNYLKDYTIVYAKYCDGTSWSGNVDSPVLVFNATSQRNQTMYYRGRRLLDALFDDLLTNRGLEDADVLLYGGCSAGSLTSYLHIDYIRTLLPPKTKLAGLADSMFALPYRSYDNSQPNHLKQMMMWGYKEWNSSYSINDRCRKHYVSDRNRPEDAWMCMHGAVVVNYVDTPMLIVNSKYDTWQKHAILGLDDEYCDPEVDTDGTVIPCGNDSPGAQARDRFWRIYASVMERTAEEVVPSHHGAFLTNCPGHCLFGWANWYDSAGPDDRLSDGLAKWVNLLEAGSLDKNNRTIAAPRWIAKERDKCFRRPDDQVDLYS